ncbi:MAG: methyltransferase domain-containing protein [Phycisphaerales bacterium]|nr:MAG: methyltransferase domain-containing protein [Phycisphaerales bacterium]
MEQVQSSENIRREVSRSYTRAVEAPSRSTCCGAAPAAQKGLVVQSAGYTADELRALPPDAVQNSFGCGNPVAFSDVREGQTVVDLGSGAGIDILLAGRKVGPSGHVIGIDMTNAMIERARRNVAAAGMTHVEVRKGTIEQLPVESGTVDWVISNCVINLSPEKPRVFAEIARVLRPGGCMMVSDLVARDLPAAVRDSPELYCSCIAGAIPEEDYLDGLRAAGLVDVEVRERLTYDHGQLIEFVRSEAGGPPCCGGDADAPAATVEDIATALAGKVHSVRIFARKP